MDIRITIIVHSHIHFDIRFGQSRYLDITEPFLTLRKGAIFADHSPARSLTRFPMSGSMLAAKEHAFGDARNSLLTLCAGEESRGCLAARRGPTN